MDPLSPQPDDEPSPQDQPSSFGSDQAARSLKSRKKLFIIAGIIAALLLVGGGFSYWAILNHNQQLAAKAKLEAARQAKARAEAKAREGTVSDLKTTLDKELKQIQEQDDRSGYSFNAALQQEADAAAAIATGNDNGL